jgi:hypothetical protein
MSLTRIKKVANFNGRVRPQHATGVNCWFSSNLEKRVI